MSRRRLLCGVLLGSLCVARPGVQAGQEGRSSGAGSESKSPQGGGRLLPPMHPDCNVNVQEMSAAQKYNCLLSSWRYACAAGRQQGLGEVCACARAQEIAAARSLAAAPPNRCSRTETDLARELVLGAKVRRLDPGEDLDPTDQPRTATRSAAGLALALIMGTALLVLAGMALWLLATDALDALARRRAMRKEDGHAR